jgi:hypothetical protein
LDTSVAGLILDGELFSRAPEKMNTFMPELKYTSTKADLEAHPGAEERIKLAYKWSRNFLGGGGQLIITPTASGTYVCTSSELQSIVIFNLYKHAFAGPATL